MQAVFEKAREAFGNGEIAWLSDDIVVMLIDLTRYRVDIAAHQWANEIPSEAIVSTIPLAGKTNAGGVLGGATVEVPPLGGFEIGAVIIAQRSEAGDRLIAYADEGPGLPTPAHGRRITLSWPNGIVRL